MAIADMGIGGAIGAIITLISQFLARKWKRTDANVDERKAVQDALRDDLANGKITDSGKDKSRLDELGGPLAIILALGLMAGCATAPAPDPIIIGERITKPTPGQTMVVPALLPPAKQWYLVDDIGLGQWLGIAPGGGKVVTP